MVDLFYGQNIEMAFSVTCAYFELNKLKNMLQKITHPIWKLNLTINV